MSLCALPRFVIDEIVEKMRVADRLAGKVYRALAEEFDGRTVTEPFIVQSASESFYGIKVVC